MVLKANPPPPTKSCHKTVTNKHIYTQLAVIYPFFNKLLKGTKIIIQPSLLLDFLASYAANLSCLILSASSSTWSEKNADLNSLSNTNCTWLLYYYGTKFFHNDIVIQFL